MLENRVLRKIRGHKREELAGHWRRLHIDKLHGFRVIKSKIMRWAGHVVCIVDRRGVNRLW